MFFSPPEWSIEPICRRRASWAPRRWTATSCQSARRGSILFIYLFIYYYYYFHQKQKKTWSITLKINLFFRSTYDVSSAHFISQQEVHRVWHASGNQVNLLQLCTQKRNIEFYLELTKQQQQKNWQGNLIAHLNTLRESSHERNRRQHSRADGKA